MPRAHTLLPAMFMLASAGSLAQQIDLGAGASDTPAEFPRTTAAFEFTRQEAMIPMRDGVKLYTVILIPHDAAAPMPIVLTRTPYNAGRRTNPANFGATRMAASSTYAVDDEPLVRNGYVRVYQDIRGRNKSEGNHVVNRPPRGPLNASGIDEATDAWDTIDWLVKNVRNNNGRVGITGVSYDGFLALMALFEPHPALQAAIPINPMVDGWMGDDWYHNGALRQTEIEWFYQRTATRDQDLTLPYGHYDIFTAYLQATSASELGRRVNGDRLPAWRRVIDNPAYTPLWEQQAIDKLLGSRASSVPTLTVHSLFDQEDIFGSISSYAAMERQDSGNARNFLILGPWRHGQTRDDGSTLGKFRWDADTARHFREKVRQPFWDQHLRGREPEHPLPPVLAFETGTNEWRSYESWPPRNSVVANRLYLRAAGHLSLGTAPARAEGFTEYMADPAKPVPYRVRPIRPMGADDSTWRTWLVDDQRPVADRPDVITFVTKPLTAPLTLVGQPVANVLASTSGTDADWVVKLIDVYPDEQPVQPDLGGYQLMVAADIFRGRYRESFVKAMPITPGRVLPYRVPLPHVSHRFLPGHRIMVQIQSSWFPLYDRNPQKFVPNIAYAQPADYTRATQRIHHSADAASFIELPVATSR